MDFGVTAALERIGIVFLFAVIGQGLSGNLPAGDSAAVGERGHEQRVDRRLLLKHVQHLLDALIHEGDGAHLNTDRPGSGRRGIGSRGGDHRPGGCTLKKISSVHVG